METVRPAVVLATPDFSAARALRGVLSLGLVGVAQLSCVAFLGMGIPCPLRSTTGLLCPVCGSTTAALHLIHGQWAEAWRANPFMIMVGLGLLLCTLAWLLELLGGPRVRPPERLRPLTSDRVLIALALPALAFAVCRNLF